MIRTRRLSAPRPAPPGTRCALAAVVLALSFAAPAARAAEPGEAERGGGAERAPVADPGPTAEAEPAARAERRNPDPFEKVNRATFAFNDALDRMLARPAARLYQTVVPEPGRIAVTNFMSNLDYPTTVINSALQGKFREAGQGAARFVVNATVGVGGLLDPATELGLPRLDEDFGQTLGRWGVPSGPFVMVPGFGPSTLRDAPTKYVDRYTNGRRYIGAGSTEWWLLGASLVDRRAQLLQADAALAAAFDPYGLVRNAYLQRREFLVRDGQTPDEDYEDFYDESLDDEPVDGATDEAPAANAAPEPEPEGAVQSPPGPEGPQTSDPSAPEAGTPPTL